jgi:hypothetical protein
MAGARHGMCELTRHGMGGERHGNTMGAAWSRHGMCEIPFSGLGVSGSVRRVFTVGTRGLLLVGTTTTHTENMQNLD